VALRLGRAVVDVGKCLTFCPRHPANLLQFSSIEDTLSESQSDFWALSLHHDGPESSPPGLREVRFTLDVAEGDGTLAPLGSIYSQDNDAIYDGLSRPGMRLVTFAPILKYGAFPLATLLDHLIKQGEDSFGQLVEMDLRYGLRANRQRSLNSVFCRFVRRFLRAKPNNCAWTMWILRGWLRKAPRFCGGGRFAPP